VTLALIVNIVMAGLVLVTIPGMIAWAIYISRNDGVSGTRAARRPMPAPTFPSPTLTPPRTSPRGPVAGVDLGFLSRESSVARARYATGSSSSSA
jgi:hypothetical protein